MSDMNQLNGCLRQIHMLQYDICALISLCVEINGQKYLAGVQLKAIGVVKRPFSQMLTVVKGLKRSSDGERAIPEIRFT